jgi:nucleoside-diphosphate-sugar epimerase
MPRILITGADGFVGRALMQSFSAEGLSATGVVRRGAGHHTTAIGDLADYGQWPTLLANVDVVVHLAARAHILNESAPDPLAEFRRVNVAATLKLAQAAAQVGVKRFVFLSSIGVNGVASTDSAFVESDAPHPTEPYAISKWEAEQGLVSICAGMELVRIRPPLIVGPGVKGNLRRLLQLVDRGLPLPFGAIHNRRSFIALDDLCDLLRLCAVHERAANDLFLAADPEQISTTDLLRRIAHGLARRALLVPIPLSLLRVAARALRVQALMERMTSSLCVNADRARTILGWSPRTGIVRGIGEMAEAYRRLKLISPGTA